MANQKGGSGKTSIAVNLGACLGLAGKRTLVMDLDSQRHATFWLGLEDNKIATSTYDVFTDERTSISDIIQETMIDHLHIAPSSPSLAHAELTLTDVRRREYVLLDKAQGLETQYEFIFIDCPPSLGLLFLNAMAYAGELFIPLDASDFLSLEGLSRLLGTIGEVQKNIHSGVKVSGIILNKFDSRINLSQGIQETIANRPELGSKLFQTVIRRNIKIAESVSFALPVILYDERCHGTQDYRNLASEVIAQ